MIRLVLIDDHAIVREGYRRLLERRADLQIVGEADSADTGYALCAAQTPDLALIDLSLPDASGLYLVQRLLQRDPGTRVLVFSMHREPLFAVQALRAGALGYVTKSSPPQRLVDAVYQVARGQRVLSPDIASEVALAMLEEETEAPGLSPREFEVLRLLMQGRSPKEIGVALHISAKTVRNCHYQLKTKLGVKSDIELTKLAMHMRMVDAAVPGAVAAGDIT